MKIVKRILLFFLFLFIALVIASVVLPIVFKDEIIEKVKTTINDNVNAKVDFNDVDISLIKSFPSVRIGIDSLTITGVDRYENVDLLKMQKLNLDIDLLSLIKDSEPYKVNSITLDHPEAMIVMDKVSGNYDIMQPSDDNSESSPFTLQLSKYEVIEGSMIYKDIPGEMNVAITGLNHTGKGDFTESIFDLDTETSIENLKVNLSGVNYLKDASANIDAKIKMDLEQGKYTLAQNAVTLNQLDIIIDGYMQLTDEEIITDFNFSTPGEDFKNFLSIIPGIYQSNIEDVTTKGRAFIDGFIKGRYNSGKNILPGFAINIDAENGYFKYPQLPKSIEDIDLKLSVSASEGNYNDMMIDIPRFNALVGNNPISGQLVTQDISTDPSVKGFLKGTIVLEDWKTALPMEDIEQMSGVIESDIEFAGRQSDIDQGAYGNVIFDGTFTGANIKYKQKSMPAISLDDLTSSISPREVKIETNRATLGSSKVNMAMEVKNPLSYMATDNDMDIKLRFDADRFNADEWMTTSETVESEPVTADTFYIPNQFTNVEIVSTIGHLTYGEYDIKNFKIAGKHRDNILKLDAFTAKVKNSDFNVSGQMENVIPFMTENQNLKGSLNIKSNDIILSDFYDEDAAVEGTSSTDNEVIRIPENMDLDLSADIGHVQYDKVDLRDVKGKITVKDGEASLVNTTTKGLGGQMLFNGLYSTKGKEKPTFAFKYDLNQLSFAQTYKAVDMVSILAPVMEFLDGKFNSTLIMEGELGDAMFPNLAMLNASGFLETYDGEFKDFKILENVSNLIGVDELKELTIDNTKSWFDVVDGTVQLKPIKKEISDVKVDFSGAHGLGKDMDYKLLLDVPREKLKSNAVTGAVVNGLGFLESEASKLGININQGDYIKLEVSIGGSLKSPKFKVKPLGSGGTSGSVKENIEASVKEVINTAKDSVKTVITKQTKVVKDSVNVIVNKAKDSITNVINDKVEEVKEQGKDKIKEVLGSSDIDSLKTEVKEGIEETKEKTEAEIKKAIDKYNPFKKKG